MLGMRSLASNIRDEMSARSAFSGGYKNYVLGLLLLAYTFNIIDRTILSTVGIRIREDLGLSSAQMGIMSGLYFALTYSLLGIPVARLAERANRVSIICMALVVWSGFTALCGTAGTYATLVAYRFGVGIGEAGCSPPSHSLISDLYVPNKRASALAVHSFGIPLGGMFGAALGGFVADWFGWRAAFFVVGIPGIVLALVMWLTVEEPHRGNSEIPARPGTLPQVSRQEPILPKAGLLKEIAEIGAVAKSLFVRWPVANMMLGITILSFGANGAGAFVPQYIYTTFPLSLGMTNSLLVCAPVAGAAHITNVKSSVLLITARQVRMHECTDCIFYLNCTSQPIIEDCTGMKFAPLPTNLLVSLVSLA